jgi:hypothetical protein
MKIINFKSSPKNNVFAPEWNYFIFERYVENIDLKNLSKFILNKENEILKLPPKLFNNKISDGYTGLGKNSTTARYDRYNVLKWNSKEILKLKINIINFHNDILKKLNLKQVDKLYAQSWMNIMRKGEKIKPHLHSVKPDCYLGGHICVKTNDTSTYYINPINQITDPEIYQSKNENGKITIFQNNIPHYTDTENSDKERITIAFDLSLFKATDNYIKLI